MPLASRSQEDDCQRQRCYLRILARSEVIASHFLVIGHDFVGGYLGGATGDALRRHSFNPIYVRDGVSVARDHDLPYFDLMWGAQSHKLQWQPKVVANHRLILGRHPIHWAPYASYHLLRSRMKMYVNSDSAPPAIKEAADKCRARYAPGSPDNKLGVPYLVP